MRYNIPMELTEGMILRYSRNILIKEIGPEGQERIFGASVLVVGAGGLGSPALLYLAAAGGGRALPAQPDSTPHSCGGRAPPLGRVRVQPPNARRRRRGGDRRNPRVVQIEESPGHGELGGPDGFHVDRHGFPPPARWMRYPMVPRMTGTHAV